MANPRRRNAFSPPYNKSQMSAWIALLVSAIQFLFFVSPILPLGPSVAITIFFFAMLAAVVYYAGLTQLIDPMDEHLAQQIRQYSGHGPRVGPPAAQETPFFSKLYDRFNPSPTEPPPNEPMKHCWICDVEVAEHSMHCKFCNKCVSHFDHHCMWLNTCVGSANYHYFYRTLVFLLAMEFTHLIVQLDLVIIIFTNQDAQQRANDWFQANAKGFVLAMLIFFMLFNVMSIFLVGQLLWFHIGLRRENLTTYQFIIREHQRKREHDKILAELERRRILAMAKARSENRPKEAWRLRVGGWCRSINCPEWDPLELPSLQDTHPTTGFSQALGGTSTSNMEPEDDEPPTSENSLPNKERQDDGPWMSDYNHKKPQLEIEVMNSQKYDRDHVEEEAVPFDERKTIDELDVEAQNLKSTSDQAPLSNGEPIHGGLGDFAASGSPSTSIRPEEPDPYVHHGDEALETHRSTKEWETMDPVHATSGKRAGGTDIT